MLNKPKILYKYRDFKNEYHVKIISEQEIYFPKPSEFNDPFDGNIPTRWDTLSFEECTQMHFDIIKSLPKYKNKTYNELWDFAKKVTHSKELLHPTKLKKETRKQILKWDNIIGLFSLAKANNNILMWSHYAKNHTGFVIGFDTNRLSCDYDFDYIAPIKYQKKYPLIKGDEDHTTKFFKKFYTKSKIWKYEKEWRVSKNRVKNRVYKVNKDCIKEVILGCNMNQKDSNSILQLIKKHLTNSVDVFKAYKNEDSFKIDIKPFSNKT